MLKNLSKCTIAALLIRIGIDYTAHSAYRPSSPALGAPKTQTEPTYGDNRAISRDFVVDLGID